MLPRPASELPGGVSASVGHQVQSHPAPDQGPVSLIRNSLGDTYGRRGPPPISTDLRVASGRAGHYAVVGRRKSLRQAGRGAFRWNLHGQQRRPRSPRNKVSPAQSPRSSTSVLYDTDVLRDEGVQRPRRMFYHLLSPSRLARVFDKIKRGREKKGAETYPHTRRARQKKMEEMDLESFRTSTINPYAVHTSCMAHQVGSRHVEPHPPHDDLNRPVGRRSFTRAGFRPQGSH